MAPSCLSPHISSHVVHGQPYLEIFAGFYLKQKHGWYHLNVLATQVLLGPEYCVAETRLSMPWRSAFGDRTALEVQNDVWDCWCSADSSDHKGCIALSKRAL